MFARSLSRSLALIILFRAALCATGQVIRLRHPESPGPPGPPRPAHATAAATNNYAHHQRPHLSVLSAPPAAQPNGAGPPHQARPGNVIVHFDRNHDIQRLQYVLQDGRLATLFQRPHDQHQSHTHGRAPVEVPASLAYTTTSGRPAQGRAKQASASSSNINAQDEPQESQLGPIINEHTIEIVDNKLNGLSRLAGGEHLTLELPMGAATIGDQPDGARPNHERLAVLATIAEDALQAGVHIGEAKLKKAGAALDKLKSKLGQKLHELPRLIGSKLRSKSSAGQVFVDQVGRKVIVVDDNGTGLVANEFDEPAAAQPQPSVTSAGEWSTEMDTKTAGYEPVGTVTAYFGPSTPMAPAKTTPQAFSLADSPAPAINGQSATGSQQQQPTIVAASETDASQTASQPPAFY